MHGDRVVARIEKIKEGGRVEGRVIRILERGNESIIGRYDRDDNGMGYVVPFDRRVLMDIFVPPGQEGGASPGEMVAAEITRWPTSTRGALGRVADVLGDIDAPGVDTEIIIRKFGIPDEHGPDAVAEAVRLGGVGLAEGHQRPHRLPERPDRHHRRRARARFRRRDHHRAAAERPLLARRAHRRRLALRPGGQRARSRGVRSRDVGVFSRARRAHVSVRAGDRAVQPQSARRPARAVVPDGGRSPRPGRARRVPRRRHQQQRADDVHGRERHPDRPRPGAAEAVRAARADVRADARALPRAQRRPAAPRVDRFRPERSRGHHRRGRRGRSDHRPAPERRAPADRRVHAARQRDGGVASGGAGRARPLPRARGARHPEGREVRGFHLGVRIQPRACR